MIVLVGFMGAGKTTVGRLVAERLGLPFVDTDVAVETRERRSVREVFAADGEEGFRDVEQAVVAEVLAGPEAVVSLGGGACGRPATRALLRTHTTVHLDVSLAQARDRTRGDAGRPMLARPDLADLHAARRPVYEGVARATVTTDGRRAEDVAREVLDVLPAPARDGGLPAPARDGGLPAPARDHKHRDGARSVLPHGPGRPEAGVPADDAAPAAAPDDLAEDR